MQNLDIKSEIGVSQAQHIEGENSVLVDGCITKPSALETRPEFLELDSCRHIKSVEDQLEVVQELHINWNSPPVKGDTHNTHCLALEEVFIHA